MADPTAKEAVLSGAGRGVALSDSKITISIAYGGESKCRQVTLTRVVKDANGREWVLDSGEMDGLFADRMISRREASELHKPGKLKP
jgi:hypothetical protein